MKTANLKMVGGITGFAGLFLIAFMILSTLFVGSVDAQNKAAKAGAGKKSAASKKAGKKNKTKKKGKNNKMEDDDDDEPRVIKLPPRGEFKPGPMISKTANSFGITPPIRDLPEAVKPENDGEGVIIDEENNEVEVIRTVDNPNIANKPFTDPLAFLSRKSSLLMSPQAMPGPIVSFNGILSVDNIAAFGTTSMPPDTVGDVGPNHYVQSVNFGVFRVYDKSGNPLTPLAKISSLFTGLPSTDECRTGDNGDPVVNYDPLADRWLISQFYVNRPTFGQCIAVSQTGDPTGAWYVYNFPSPAGNFPDYPHWAVWTDAYYVSTHEFNAAGTAYVTGGFYAYNREKMLVGDPTAGFIYFSDPNSFGHLPADVDGYLPPPAGTSQYFLEFDSAFFGGADQIIIHELVPDFATPGNSTFTLKTPVPVAAFDPRNPTGRGDVEQPVVPANAYLDSIGGRALFRVAYRNLGTSTAPVNSYVTNLTVNVSGVQPTTAATYQAAVRWEELRRNGAGAVSVFDQGTHAPDPVSGTGRNRWMGSIAQDYLGNIGVGFSRSGPGAGEFPDIVWAGRTGGQVAAGTLNEGEATMKASTGYQNATNNRWGDYSAMNVDPIDDCTFWYTQEWRDAAYNGTTNSDPFKWSTQIGSFKFPGCAAAPKGQIASNVTDCNTNQPIEGAAVIAQAGGFLRTTDASGSLISNIIAAPGDYIVSASKRGYATSTTANVTVTDGNTVIGNVCLGDPFTILELVANPVPTPVDENGNGRFDSGESANLSVPLTNTGGLDATNVSATLTTTTPGVTILPPQTISYPDIPSNGGTASGASPFTFKLDRDFVCGNSIDFTLTLNYNGTTAAQTIDFTVATIPPFSVSTTLDTTIPPTAPEYTATTGTQTGRIARQGSAAASNCSAPKSAPGIFATTGERRYDAYTFTAAAAGCITVTLESPNGVNLFSVAYNSAGFVPANPNANYLADAGTSSPQVSYSFNVTAGQKFTIVVHEVNAGSGINSNYTLSLTGPVDRGCQVFPLYEGDVITRPDGDGVVDASDVQMVRNFSVGIGLPYQGSEFRRADSSPRSSLGDGLVDGDDVQQTRRYSVGTDPLQNAGGPTSGTSAAEFNLFSKKSELPFGIKTPAAKSSFLAPPAAFRVDAQSASPSSTLVVPIRVDTVGNEAGYTFSIAYDSTKLTNPQVAIGNGGGDVIFNTATAGQIGFSVTGFAGGTIAEGNNIALVNVTFTVAASAPAGPTNITFTDTPARRKASGVDPNTPITQPTYTGGTITILGPTAAGVTISGRVLTSRNRGITGAVVQLTDQTGNTQTARTNAFGYYTFNDVEAGQSIVMTAVSKRYKFTPQVINLTENLTGINFIGANP